MNLILKIAVFILASFTAVSFSWADASAIKIVASQRAFAEIAQSIGKEKIEVKSVASPKFNVHFFEPRPSDVRNVAKADLVIYNGLDLEAWWDPLLEAAGKTELFRGRARSVDLSQGVRLLNVPDHVMTRAEGDIHLFGNPHYIMNPMNAKIAASTLSRKLQEIDSPNARFYKQNEAAFLKALDEKIAEWKKRFAPYAGYEILSYHDDIAYLAEFLNLKSEQFLEPKPGIPPTPKHLEFLSGYVKEKKIRVIVLPTYFSKENAEKLAKRVGAKVVTICQNVGELPGTENLLDFYESNFERLYEALKTA